MELCLVFWRLHAISLSFFCRRKQFHSRRNRILGILSKSFKILASFAKTFLNKTDSALVLLNQLKFHRRILQRTHEFPRIFDFLLLFVSLVDHRSMEYLHSFGVHLQSSVSNISFWTRFSSFDFMKATSFWLT
jgi:hypothetical protein